MLQTQKSTAICIFMILVSFTAWGQTKPQSLNRKAKEAIISEISALLDQFYIFPDKAKEMGAALQKNLQTGSYDEASEPEAFASAINKDLHNVYNDKHMGFMFMPEFAEQLRKRQSRDEKQSTEARQRAIASMRKENFGFRKVERLAGNVGYLDFRMFADADIAGETAVAALNFLSNCDAIIIDLRQNGGGDPTQIQLISSYFFDKPTHLNDIYTRSENKTENFWTLPYVPGRKLANADLYILTSGSTFSGAEEFSYNMKNLKRATLIGETTGGGAHPTDEKIIHENFILDVPNARAINPITKTNWEGTGVSPDVTVSASQAMDRAYVMALEKLASKSTDPASKKEVEWVLSTVKARMNPVVLSESTMRTFTGVYEDRKVTLENGQLFYQRTGPKYRMIPLNDTVFILDGLDDFRLQFVVKDGKATEVIGIYSDGSSEPSRRTD